MPGRARTNAELEGLLAAEQARSAALEREVAAGLARERAAQEVLRAINEGQDDAQAVLDATGEVLRAIAESPSDLDVVLDRITATAVRLCGALRGTVRLVEPEGLRAAGSSIASEPGAIGAGELGPIDPGSVYGRAVLERRVVHLPDPLAPAAGLAVGGSRLISPAGPALTVLAVPLMRGDEVIGVFALRREEGRPFSEREIALVGTFADQAVIAIENARLFAELQARTEELAEKSRQLEEASQHKSAFLANMSHELRTPLNAIIGFTEVLLEKYFGEINAKQEDYLRDVLTSGQHLLALINDILDLSKVEAGRMELEVGPFELGAALEAGLAMVRERASRKAIALSLAGAEEVGPIEADERKIKQVLFNLLTNAVKFTPEGGRVSVSARRRDGQVEVEVADTGVGIAPEEQARVFEEFGQAHNQAGQTEGTGLGLALCKRYVELHGGTISVASAVGRGSTFTVALPVRGAGAH